MSAPGPTFDRNETPLERLDRNWVELLQEVRVVQTGVQLLTGFLLILPFQDRFWRLSEASQALYLVTVVIAASSTACLITPVAMHRILFRLGARPTLVAQAQRFALAGLALLGVAVCCVLTLTFGIVVSKPWGMVAGGVSLAVFGSAWLLLPLWVRRQLRASASEPGSADPA